MSARHQASPRSSGAPRSPRRRARARRLRVAVIYGGRSVEHEVSLVSARAIMEALDPARYEVLPILVSRDGRWSAGRFGSAARTPAPVREIFRFTGAGGGSRPVDVVFPIIHGTGGEDGTLQGLLTLAGIPFVGAGVLGSALGMDKTAMKSMFQEAGLPIVRYRPVSRGEYDADPDGTETLLERHCGYPSFVKPANGGSSVGISKCHHRAGLQAALRLAFRYDHRVVVETAVDGREIECSVLGNENPEASVAGEIVPAGEFYDYESKYADTGSRLVIPAPLGRPQQILIRDLSIRAFQALDLAGFARVDFFVERNTGAVLLNEVNTLPGFTPISMYPKLWEASGLSFPRLVDRLIALALERHAQGRRLVTSFGPGGRSGRGRGGTSRRR
jgi:D-alanine-D-alanine ligase